MLACAGLEMIAEAALQEDVDVVGLSVLSGARGARRILELLKPMDNPMSKYSSEELLDEDCSG
ncbi:MAG: hypothetical protein U0Z26_01865 [Anaerolineales bacterium]